MILGNAIIGNIRILNDSYKDGMTIMERIVKRFIDICVSTISMVVFSPLFLICYIVIKCIDGGPVIFKQERIGRFEKPFYIYKFRSMRLDAEKSGPSLYQHEKNKRMTRTGRFLRTHHLDELPQLWNVLRGDMSFVGPRPERQYYINQIIKHDPRYTYLYQIRPGVTSYATLYNGYTDSMEKMLRRLELDLYYLEHRSWLLDIKILINTFLNIAIGKKF
ncbi:bacterial sugar transferase [Prevotella sp. DNF00663]|uniref:sugar transferase n=1 Tax=Prevotella sp. DNF00663 TaxID=1384078 RepID=UPI000782709E|nr:sugar transferase [Prevotella sp. DNF00663]KXB82285.1 bacterial sugar transferase [Prevotella sp. DNF00663]